MESSAAAIWSAVAAFFAAGSSLLIWRTQRRNFLESMRPEMVLLDWSRGKPLNQPADQRDVVRIGKIKNVGRGQALHVHVHLHPLPEKIQDGQCFPQAFFTFTRHPIVAANEEVLLNGELSLMWQNVDARPEGGKHLHLTVRILCWDLAGRRHEVLYKLLAVERGSPLGVSDPIAPEVMLSSRTTVVRPVWFLKLSRRALNIWALTKPQVERVLQQVRRRLGRN